MDWVYLVCAAAGGTVLVVQFLLMLIGLDHDGDTDSFSDFEADEAGTGGNLFFAHLSMKTVVAFMTFFGLTGMLMDSLEVARWQGGFIAGGAGLVAFYVVAFLMSSLSKLQSQGNVELGGAVGSMATVYLKIPESGAGAGKITLSLQSRTVELKAITRGEEIPTGSQVVVVGVDGDVAEVTSSA